MKNPLMLLVAIIVIGILSAGSARAAIANCTGCVDCTNKIAAASSGDTIQLTSSISDYANSCVSFGGKSNVIFDCLGNTIDGNDGGFYDGILLNSVNNDTVKNCRVTDFESGIYVVSGSNHTLTNVTASSCWEGVSLYNASWSVLNGVTSYSNSESGVSVKYGGNNSLTGINASYNAIYGVQLDEHTSYDSVANMTAKENSHFDFYLDMAQSLTCTNSISNATGSGGRPIMYYSNSPASLSGQTASELILCNASYSSIDNITIIGSTNVTNNGMLVYLTNHSSFRNINSSYRYYGVYSIFSNGNTFDNITANSNEGQGGLTIEFGDGNNISNVVSNSNEFGLYLAYFTNGTVTDVTAGSNAYSGIYLYGSGNSLGHINASENMQRDIELDASDESDCNNLIYNATGSGGLPIEFYNSAVNLSGQTLSELILCNAHDSSITNLTIAGSGSAKNNGLYVYATNHSIFSNINSSDRYDGLYFSESSGNTLADITADSNARTGVYFEYGSDNSIAGIAASSNGDSGVYITDSQGNNVSGLVANSNSNYGIDLLGSFNTISNATTNLNGDTGVYFESDSDYNDVTDITSGSNSNYGVYLGYCNNNVFSRINASYNDGSGLDTDSSSNNSFSNLSLISNAGNGIYLFGDSRYNTISDSRLEDSGQYGIYIVSNAPDFPRYNLLYNNYFNNSENFFSDNESNENHWNVTSSARLNIIDGPYMGGNFWATPSSDGNSETCNNSKHAGFCDSPYELGDNNTDYLPLTMNDSMPPYYDHEAGFWADSYNDGTGISSESGANVSGGALMLTNSSGGFDSPYLAGGYAITTTIIPISVAEWGNVTFDATLPNGTSMRIQVLDESNTIYPDSMLPGNTVGFSSSHIDVSGIQSDVIASEPDGAKFGRLRLKVTMNTTDANATPALNHIALSWLVRRGDMNASSLANSSWPLKYIDSGSSRHTPFYSSPDYPALFWVKDMGIDGGGDLTIGPDGTLFSKNSGTYESTQGGLYAINRSTGATIWQRNITFYSDSRHTLSQDGTLYVADMWYDMLLAYNTTDGRLKWTYQFYGGHGNDYVSIGSDGTLFTIRYNADTLSVYAFNPNGTVKWNMGVTLYDEAYASDTALYGDKLYFGAATTTAGGENTGGGRLYAISQVNGSIIWDYPTGDSGYMAPAIDADGIIYLGQQTTNSSAEKGMYAIYPNGTLKWKRSIGAAKMQWNDLSLRSDGMLLAYRTDYEYSATFDADIPFQRSIEAINRSDGSLIWASENLSSDIGTANLFSDGNNGFYSNQDLFSYDSFSDVNASILHYDSSFNRKWSIFTSGTSWIRTDCYDEDGIIYGNMVNSSGPYTRKVFAVRPWTLSVPAIGTLSPGAQLNFSITTSMKQVNPLSGEGNMVQIVLDNGDKALLGYDSTDASGDTIWTGNYTIPSNASAGNHSFTVEASAAWVQTDIPVHFASPANSTNNTGINATGSFSVAAPSYCGDGHCDSLEACGLAGYCSNDCGACSSGGQTSPSPSSGSGGGGSAEPSHLEKEWDMISPWTQALFEINQANIAFTSIDIHVQSGSANASISLVKLDSRPGEVTELFSGKAYQYMKVNVTNMSVRQADIAFKVPKAWIVQNNIDTGKVFLNRYVGSEWIKLNTSYAGEDNASVSYVAKTPGFSYFLITGEPKLLPKPPKQNQTAPACNSNSICEPGESLASCPQDCTTEMPCQVNEVRCSGNFIQLCTQVGEWKAIVECPEGCHDGICVHNEPAALIVPWVYIIGTFITITASSIIIAAIIMIRRYRNRGNPFYF